MITISLLKKLLNMKLRKDLSLPHYSFLFVNDIPSCLKTAPRCFADDTALLIDSNNTTELQILTNIELANINQWMTAYYLVVNANKTIALIISPNLRNNNDTLSHVLNGETVCSSNSSKYLIITIDNQLSFETHIDNLENFSVCRCYCKTKLLSSTQYFINFLLLSSSFPFP